MSGQMTTRLQAIFGGPVQRRLARWTPLLPRIAAFEPQLQQQSDSELRKRSLSLRYRAKSREPLDRLLCEAFALVREAGRRRLNMRHFDVQLLGGVALCNSSIAEMQTGEGKTLTATPPCTSMPSSAAAPTWPRSTITSPAATPIGCDPSSSCWACRSASSNRK